MRPVRTAWTKLVYHGPEPEIGDLWCKRVEPGLIDSVWEPDEHERRVLAEGGRIVLSLKSEPIPPISLRVVSDEDSTPVAEHGFRIPAELEERERAEPGSTARDS